MATVTWKQQCILEVTRFRYRNKTNFNKMFQMYLQEARSFSSLYEMGLVQNSIQTNIMDLSPT